MLTVDIKKKIIEAIQGDIPMVQEPFKELAKKIGISESQLINEIENWLKNGTIRRFGAILEHHRAGFTTNAMVVWNVPEPMVDKAGQIMSSFKEVSHCYERETNPLWHYNFFTMIHARSKDEFLQIVRQLSDLTGIRDYKILWSLKELKKTSMVYFLENEF